MPTPHWSQDPRIVGPATFILGLGALVLGWHYFTDQQPIKAVAWVVMAGAIMSVGFAFRKRRS